MHASISNRETVIRNREEAEMSTDAVIRPGHEPWLPCSEATDLDVFHLDEVPTLGTFTVRGETVAFTCLSGHLDRVSVWAYCMLTQAEIEAAGSASFGSLRETQAWFSSLFTNREVMFATAAEHVIDNWSPHHDVGDDLLAEAVRFVKSILEAKTSRDEWPKRIEQVTVDAVVRELAASAR